ncbi:Na+-transporting NADH:ubiquinone oxidoreductase subunit C [Natronincola peptidivorans]|uniref:Na+-transporting NADH:ubiquinone oxidoreductase subunit C n=1 Tax=Natronincola peptidivorans TaxID=426128 RepID=A0A1I0FUQ3_9FIRM|nr:FMN-binding protein [Natronincola peptidivorans]SET62032.1 Na+-transporting NADH:ubiquinone oxidoreductase subunit C [Natronincola peptidivorans]
MKKFSFKPIAFMMVLTIIYTGVLATINEATIDRIQMNNQLRERKAFLYALDIDTSDKNAEEINSLYDDHVQEITVSDKTIYEGYKDDELIGYLLPIEGDAVWGELKAIIAVTPDFQEVLGIDFLSHNETPGLGGRIDEDSFKEQFRNITLDLDKEDDFIVYNPDPDGQVDSISGATGTSNAVRRILNNNLSIYISEVKGELEND